MNSDLRLRSKGGKLLLWDLWLHSLVPRVRIKLDFQYDFHVTACCLMLLLHLLSLACSSRQYAVHRLPSVPAVRADSHASEADEIVDLCHPHRGSQTAAYQHQQVSSSSGQKAAWHGTAEKSTQFCYALSTMHVSIRQVEHTPPYRSATVL
eukprot:COSAG02_NODE_2563_length_8525_cov_90.068835_3_plen_151_part_00